MTNFIISGADHRHQTTDYCSAILTLTLRFSVGLKSFSHFICDPSECCSVQESADMSQSGNCIIISSTAVMKETVAIASIDICK